MNENKRDIILQAYFRFLDEWDFDDDLNDYVEEVLELES